MDKYCPGGPKWTLVKPAIGYAEMLVVPIGFLRNNSDRNRNAKADWDEFRKHFNLTVY